MKLHGDPFGIIEDEIEDGWYTEADKQRVIERLEEECDMHPQMARQFFEEECE